MRMSLEDSKSIISQAQGRVRFTVTAQFPRVLYLRRVLIPSTIVIAALQIWGANELKAVQFIVVTTPLCLRILWWCAEELSSHPIRR